MSLARIRRSLVSALATSPGGFWHPTHVAFLAPRTLFVADRGANCIRRVELDDR